MPRSDRYFRLKTILRFHRPVARTRFYITKCRKWTDALKGLIGKDGRNSRISNGDISVSMENRSTNPVSGRAVCQTRLARCRIQTRVHLTPSATSTIRESRTYANWPAHNLSSPPFRNRYKTDADGEILLTGIRRKRLPPRIPNLPRLIVRYQTGNLPAALLNEPTLPWFYPR